jgi:uncharacterized Fe-S cluster protein YjdI
MTKKVLYEGKEYKIFFQSYGYGYSRFCVNGEPTSFYIPNEKLTNVESFKSYAKKAIKEYIAKKVAEDTFEQWDGKI